MPSLRAFVFLVLLACLAYLACAEAVDVGPCASNPCSPGTCSETGDDYTCNCASTSHYGPHCEHPCECNQFGSENLQCNDEGKCTCLSGYSGDKCDTCIPGYYLDENQCKECNCSSEVGAGIDDGTCQSPSGDCKCKGYFGGAQCDQCTYDSYGYPECNFCYCSIDGSVGLGCDDEGQCECKPNFQGAKCADCIPGKWGDGACNQDCDCPVEKVTEAICYQSTGSCACKAEFWGNECENDCLCNPEGTFSLSPEGQYCDFDGTCHCKDNFDGDHCDQCKENRYGPTCQPCNCGTFAVDQNCDSNGNCTCIENATGSKCNECQHGFFGPECSTPCGCNEVGSLGANCYPADGECFCKDNFAGLKCDTCAHGFNGPNCDPLQPHCEPGFYSNPHATSCLPCPENSNSAGGDYLTIEDCTCNTGFHLSEGECDPDDQHDPSPSPSPSNGQPTDDPTDDPTRPNLPTASLPPVEDGRPNTKPKTVSVTFRLTNIRFSWYSSSSENAQTFRQAFKADMALILQISPSDIEITSVKEGSVIVNFKVQSSQPDTVVAQVDSFLSSSSSSSSSFTTLEAALPEDAYENPDQGVGVDAEKSSSSVSKSANVGAIVGGVIGGVAGVAILGGLAYFFVVRNRQNSSGKAVEMK